MCREEEKRKLEKPDHVQQTRSAQIPVCALALQSDQPKLYRGTSLIRKSNLL